MGADARAANSERYELKLLSFLRFFIIFKYLRTYFSRSFWSSQARICDRAQKDILLKCSVKQFKLGISSSFCSLAQISSSGI